jgi:hypothetical protein
VSRGYKLQKLKAGDYLLYVAGDSDLWRLVKYEGLGTGARGMHGMDVWGVERWLGRPSTSPDPDDPRQWEMVDRDRDTRTEAINALLKRLSAPAHTEDKGEGHG